MATNKKNKDATAQREQNNMNNKAMLRAFGSLHKRGVTIESMSKDLGLIITFNVMKSKYYLMYSGQISQEECRVGIEESWNKHLQFQSDTAY